MSKTTVESGLHQLFESISVGDYQYLKKGLEMLFQHDEINVLQLPFEPNIIDCLKAIQLLGLKSLEFRNALLDMLMTKLQEAEPLKPQAPAIKKITPISADIASIPDIGNMMSRPAISSAVSKGSFFYANTASTPAVEPVMNFKIGG